VRTKHGAILLPLVASALEHAALDRRAIELVAVGLGPGSFTGTRIGVATAKGLSLALDRPLMGVCSLRAIARAAPGSWVVAATDAYKGEVYAALYERVPDGSLIERAAPIHAAPLRAAEAMRAACPGALVACGTGVRHHLEAFGAALGGALLPALWDAPRAAIIALEASERFAVDGPDDRAALEPLYVRASDATLPR
jgi:tRNA threonylcarbamoyladenosine biosynthesis protein TsaB